MRIHCFGCSWTFDIYENSWPQILANRYPQHQIYNYSMEATDPLYSLYCMSKIKKQKTIFLYFKVQVRAGQQVFTNLRLVIFYKGREITNQWIVKDCESFAT